MKSIQIRISPAKADSEFGNPILIFVSLLAVIFVSMIKSIGRILFVLTKLIGRIVVTLIAYPIAYIVLLIAILITVLTQDSHSYLNGV